MIFRLPHAVLGAVALVVPGTVAAAPIGFFGPIVPEMCRACPAAWGCAIGLLENLIAFGLSLTIIIAILMFTWAGFMWVFNSAVPAYREKARKILLNTAIGMVIAFAAWLIVNTLLGVFTNYTVDSATSIFGSKGGDNACIGASGPEVKTIALGGGPIDTAFAARINAFQKAASDAGLRAVYEVANEARKTNLVTAGVTGSIAVVSYITAEHFSVYDSAGSGGTASASLKNAPACATCTSITHVPCKSASSCTIAASFNTKLKNIPANNPAIGIWHVTEAFPPTTTAHNSVCHYIGTCIDVGFR